MSWKSRLYNVYVSSGQFRGELRSDQMRATDVFGSRAHFTRNAIANHLPQDRQARILDLACGHGVFLYYLRAAGYTNISGADISPEQIELAHNLGVPEAKCCDMFSVLQETDSESVDAILLMDILEHLTIEELFRVLDEVFRVLKKDGTCVVHVPNGEGIFGMRILYGDLTHERAFAPKSAEQLFKTVGFRDVKSFEDRPLVHGVVSFARRVIWECGSFGYRILLAAETGGSGFILSQNMLVSARK